MAKRRKLSQFASDARFFVERARQFLDDAGKEHARIVALPKAANGRSVVGTFWPQTPRELAERVTLCNSFASI